MDLLKVNGVKISTPQTLEYQRYDLDSEEGSGRNQNGLMFRDRKATKVKIVCTWPPLEDSEMRVLLNSVKSTFFTLEYPDPYEPTGRRTMTAYVGDRTSPLFKIDHVKNVCVWEGLSMNFIER